MQISFKTWDTKKKEWLHEIPPREYMLDSEVWGHCEDDDLMYYPSNPLPSYNGRLVHCQFTGAKDKLGKEIYNEDIISVLYHKNNTQPIIGYVKYHEDKLCYLVWRKGGLMFHMDTFYKNPDCEVTVLGSYLSNPEMWTH